MQDWNRGSDSHTNVKTIYPLDMAWNQRFSGAAKTARAAASSAAACLISMGVWCEEARNH